MRKRPTSVTVIAWILIITGGLAIIVIPFALNSPMTKEIMNRSRLPISVQYFQAYAGLLVTFVSGIAILKGRNWGRLLYVLWSIIGFVITLVTMPIKLALVPGILFFIVVAFFLYRPKATEYFRGVPEEKATVAA
jgi:hypothetical protein